MFILERRKVFEYNFHNKDIWVQYDDDKKFAYIISVSGKKGYEYAGSTEISDLLPTICENSDIIAYFRWSGDNKVVYLPDADQKWHPINGKNNISDFMEML